MKVTNLTDKVQKLRVKPLIGDREEFDIYIQEKGSTDIDWHFSIKQENYAGIFSFDGVTPSAPVKDVPKTVEEVEPVVEEIKEIQESSAETDVVEDVPAVEESPEEVAPASYICEICGAEFASARGLQSHKNRVHK